MGRHRFRNNRPPASNAELIAWNCGARMAREFGDHALTLHQDPDVLRLHLTDEEAETMDRVSPIAWGNWWSAGWTAATQGDRPADADTAP